MSKPITRDDVDIAVKKAVAENAARKLRGEPEWPLWWTVQDELVCTAAQASAYCRLCGYDPHSGHKTRRGGGDDE